MVRHPRGSQWQAITTCNLEEAKGREGLPEPAKAVVTVEKGSRWQTLAWQGRSQENTHAGLILLGPPISL